MAVKPLILRLLLAAGLCAAAAPPLRAQLVSENAQGVNVNLVQVELRAAVQALGQYIDRPIFFGDLGGQRVTFTSPRPVPREDLPALLRSLLAQNGYVMEEADGGAYTIRAAGAPPAGSPGAAQGPPASQQPFAGAGGGGPSLASAGGVELFVIHLRHARASDVAAVINALYGRASAVGEIGQRRGTLNDELNANRVADYGQPPPQLSAGATASGEFRGQVIIVPDPRTNSLLVRAARPDYELVRAAVEQVDVRPLQVLIEATVAYVRRDFNFNYGVQAGVGDLQLERGSNTLVGGETPANDIPGLVIRALNLGGIDLDLLLRAGVSRSSVVIMDRPLLLAANNEEAEIVVGEQRPFTQVQRSTDGGVLDEVVQYKDVGTSLRVLPTISGDGFVQLRVVQEVNSAAGSAEGIDAPIISTRSISTQLLVRDGHTAVLGGLANTQRDRSSGGIPFLSDIPLIGGIFGRKGRANNDFELFIFITPHVIYSDDDMDGASEEVRQNRPGIRRATGRLRPFVGGEVAEPEPPPTGEPVVDAPAPPSPGTP